MKKFLPIAISIVAFLAISCQREDPVSNSKEVTFSATFDDSSSKAFFGPSSDGVTPVRWGEVEKIGVVINKDKKIVSLNPSPDGSSATFSVKLPSASSYEMAFISPSDALLFVQTDGYGLEIPQLQTPTSTSCDPKAIVLGCAKSYSSLPAAGSQITFRHLVSYGKMTLKNLPLKSGEKIEKVQITADIPIVGRFKYVPDKSTVVEGFNDGQLKTLEIHTDSPTDIYFALRPSKPQSFKVSVYTVQGSVYTREISFVGHSNPLIFTLGEMSIFSVDFKTSSSSSHLFHIPGTGGAAAWKDPSKPYLKGDVSGDYSTSHSPYLTKLSKTGQYLQVKVEEAVSAARIGVKMVGGAGTSYITLQGSVDGKSFTDIEKFTIKGAQNSILTFTSTATIDPTYRYIKFYYTRGSNIGVGPVTLYGIGDIPEDIGGNPPTGEDPGEQPGGDTGGETPGGDTPPGGDNPGGENPGGDAPSGEPNGEYAKMTGWLELPKVVTADGYYVKTQRAVGPSGKEERNYTYFYEASTYTSLWVAYHICKAHTNGSHDGTWKFDPLLPQNLQTNLNKSYGVNYNSNNPYSRGHQIARADRKGVSAMVAQTYYPTNSTPQIQNGFNGGVWSDLEKQVREVPSSATDTVYVVTGASFNKVGENKTVKYITNQNDGKSIPVPNYYWKAVMTVTRSGGVVTDAKMVGFWMEHKTYAGGVQNQYTISIKELESFTGFEFFTNIPKSIADKAKTNSTWKL